MLVNAFQGILARNLLSVLVQVREEMLAIEAAGKSFVEVSEHAQGRVLSWLQENTSDFIGDHYVPKIFCREIEEFHRQKRWLKTYTVTEDRACHKRRVRRGNSTMYLFSAPIVFLHVYRAWLLQLS